jgi:predicted ATP-dependent protease
LLIFKKYISIIIIIALPPSIPYHNNNNNNRIIIIIKSLPKKQYITEKHTEKNKKKTKKFLKRVFLSFFYSKSPTKYQEHLYIYYTLGITYFKNAMIISYLIHNKTKKIKNNNPHRHIHSCMHCRKEKKNPSKKVEFCNNFWGNLIIIIFDLFSFIYLIMHWLPFPFAIFTL